jgi:hypothetical protein
LFTLKARASHKSLKNCTIFPVPHEFCITNCSEKASN